MSTQVDSATHVTHGGGTEATPVFRKYHRTESGFRWDDVPLMKYKEDGTHFKSISRQILFTGEADQPCELRYFEVDPGGHSTLEKHVHTHAIMIIRGRGRAVLGDTVVEIQAFDLLRVPPMTWHQLHAADDDPLGFLCQVSCDRDRPIRPDDSDRRILLSDPVLSPIVRL